MRIGFVQFDCRFGHPEENLSRVDRLVAATKADLVVLPELFHCGYLFASKEEVEEAAITVPDRLICPALSSLAARVGGHIVAGVAERAEGRLYNSAIVVGPRGVVGTYRKVHLYAEEKRWFAPGDLGFPVWDLGGVKVGVMVCFDWFFPESMRTLALRGAEVVAHPANLVLPYCPAAMPTRCLENRVFAITANRIGVEKRGGKKLAYIGRSQVVGTRADVLVAAGADTEEARFVDVDPAQARSKRLNEWNDLLGDRRPESYESGRGIPLAPRNQDT